MTNITYPKDYVEFLEHQLEAIRDFNRQQLLKNKETEIALQNAEMCMIYLATRLVQLEAKVERQMR